MGRAGAQQVRSRYIRTRVQHPYLPTYLPTFMSADNLELSTFTYLLVRSKYMVCMVPTLRLAMHVYVVHM